MKFTYQIVQMYHTIYNVSHMWGIKYKVEREREREDQIILD